MNKSIKMDMPTQSPFSLVCALSAGPGLPAQAALNPSRDMQKPLPCVWSLEDGRPCVMQVRVTGLSHFPVVRLWLSRT